MRLNPIAARAAIGFSRSSDQRLHSHSSESMVWLEDTVTVPPGGTVDYSSTVRVEFQQFPTPKALYVIDLPFTLTITRRTEQPDGAATQESARSAAP